ncbi:hypothetical protein P43SY_000840 [Pythium insidiosum]|uniref:Uncharacterized protein n=1 Tax=Pythium insidiosum TaxID=114742 RepID=A0AAD5LW67_PYTIN|nr:hypothetical protein P43SY_000840 [Pythium insidiosum]
MALTVSPLRNAQVSRATYLDLCMQLQAQIDALTDSLEREAAHNALQDEKTEFFSAVERGRLVLGDTVLHVAVRLGHESIVDFLLLADHVPRPLTGAGPPPTPSTPSARGTARGSARGTPGAPRGSTGIGLNSTQTPNFKGELPRDVAASPVLRLVLDHVADVHDVFGVEYRDEPRLHRFVRALRRVWPLWMFEGQSEAAGLVRVLYAARSSDAAFAGLVKLALAVAERLRVVVARSGLRLAVRLLRDAGGELSAASRALQTEWPPERKLQQLFGLFAGLLRTWQPRRHADRDAAYVEFFDAAVDAWLQVAQDLQLVHAVGGDDAAVERVDAATLRRYELQMWKRRLRPPPAVVDDLCVHVSALEQFLGLAGLQV